MYLLLSLFIALTLARAPLKTGDHPERIDGSYVVLFNPTATAELQAKHRAGLPVQWKYNITKDFMGYSASLTDEQLEYVLNDPIVKEVHHDHAVHVFQPQCDTRQTNVRAWGICRTAHVGKLSFQSGAAALTTFKYDAGQGGSGVDVYVLDTGILITHSEFEGRAVWGMTFTPDGVRTDDQGHGTHCAGAIGGVSVGLARDCRLVAVKVLDRYGAGTLSGVIAGCDWVAATVSNRRIPAVASMSLGGGYSEPLNEAVRNLIRSGVITVVAAGNENFDACNISPASTEEALTVGATTTDANFNDVRSSFSNYGPCVDIFAPGSNIFSCGIESNTAYASMSGTSTATPHVAGIAAIILQKNPTLTPARVKEEVINNSNWDIVADNKGSKNDALLYNGC